MSIDRPSKAEYVEAMQGMFLTRGWRQHFKAQIAAIRANKLELLVYATENPDDIRAARDSVRILDEILNIEEGVKSLAQELVDNPEDAQSVVESPQEVEAP